MGTKYIKEKGFREEVFYIDKLMKLPNLNNRTATTQRTVPMVHYKNAKEKWPGFIRSDNFVVRWSGILTITAGGPYKFSLASDDGSRVFLGPKLLVNNDGTHALRRMESTAR